MLTCRYKQASKQTSIYKLPNRFRGLLCLDENNPSLEGCRKVITKSGHGTVFIFVQENDGQFPASVVHRCRLKPTTLDWANRDPG